MLSTLRFFDCTFLAIHFEWNNRSVILRLTQLTPTHTNKQTRAKVILITEQREYEK